MSGEPKNPKSSVIDQKNNSAVSPKNAPSTLPEYHDDYDKIQAAVLETKRGRWFLGEFARKNKQVESQMVLDALATLESKIEAKSTSKPSQVESEPQIDVKPATEQKPDINIVLDDFESAQQSSFFSQLFARFKQKTINSLEWAGLKTDIEFSKIQTIVNFATMQSQKGFKTQEKNLIAIIQQLQTENTDPKLIQKLNTVVSELNKLEILQTNLNIQLENSLKFASQAEKISQNIEPILVETEQKQPKKPQKTAENEPKSAKIEQKTAEKPQKKAKLGPAGRIKKMFKIEHMLQDQITENIAEPAKAFDEAFAAERLGGEPPETVQIIAEEKSAQPTQISEQADKLASIGDMMKQVEEIKNNAPKTTDLDVETEPKIIIEKEYNALNSLALLSKTERTMLFTMQH